MFGGSLAGRIDFSRPALRRRALALVFAGPQVHFANVKEGWKKFIQSWLITAFAVLVTAVLLPGKLRYGTPTDLFLAALLLGLFHAFLRPWLVVLALPLVIFSLGLFVVIINGALLYLVHAVMGARFEIAGFWWAVLASVLIGVISLPLQILTGTTKSRITVRRGRPPRSDSGGDGPVIDV